MNWKKLLMISVAVLMTTCARDASVQQQQEAEVTAVYIYGKFIHEGVIKSAVVGSGGYMTVRTTDGIVFKGNGITLVKEPNK